MALVTLANAKVHLRITGTTYDADVQLKLDQAEAIILDYLKVRLIAIASVSSTNPAVVTTTVPHSLTSGLSYPILGTTTTPTINGSQVVTVTSPTTFTVPVNVTAGQADEAGTVGATTWDTSTVPKEVQAAVLVMLTHLYENPGDNMQTVDETAWQAVERLLMRRRDPALA